MKIPIWLIERDWPTVQYDEYYSEVIAAPTSKEALTITQVGNSEYAPRTIKQIGETLDITFTTKGYIICSDFNAG